MEQLKAAELRIGNWIQHDGFPFEVYSEIFVDIESLGVIFHPIPLTKDILLNCGFEKAPETDPFGGFLISIHEGYSIRLRKDIVVGWNWDYNGLPIVLPYVHSVQNLYFALTGEELTVNL